MVADSFQLLAHASSCTQKKSEPLEQEKKEMMYVSLALLLLWTLPTSSVKLLHSPSYANKGEAIIAKT